MILDIHTHNPEPDTRAVIDLSAAVAETASEFEIPERYSFRQMFSVGIHPWTLLDNDVDPEVLKAVEKLASHPQVVLIGEAGIDIPKGGPLFRQMNVFKSMIDLSEKVGKPLLIHNVKAQDIIIGLHRDIRPRQPWIIHGFRQKPSVAEMLLKEGLHLSFGPMFNPVTLRAIPSDRILAETDDSLLPVDEVIERLSDSAGYDLTQTIARNSNEILHPAE